MSDTLNDEAASAAILGLDSSRRVGWAKAYDYRDQLDVALKDGNVWRGDRDAFKRGLSFMFGLFMEWTANERSELFKKVLGEVTGYDALLDPNVVKAGRQKARSIREADELYAEERALVHASKAAAKKSAMNAENRRFKEAKQRAVEALAARYGFDSVDELEAVLAGWQKAAGREPRDPADLRELRRRRRLPSQEEERQ